MEYEDETWERKEGEKLNVYGRRLNYTYRNLVSISINEIELNKGTGLFLTECLKYANKLKFFSLIDNDLKYIKPFFLWLMQSFQQRQENYEEFQVSFYDGLFLSKEHEKESCYFLSKIIETNKIEEELTCFMSTKSYTTNGTILARTLCRAPLREDGKTIKICYGTGWDKEKYLGSAISWDKTLNMSDF